MNQAPPHPMRLQLSGSSALALQGTVAFTFKGFRSRSREGTHTLAHRAPHGNRRSVRVSPINLSGFRDLPLIP